MDPTLLAALAGIIGAIIGAVLGGVFALKAAKRQVEVMVQHSRGDVNERLYNQSLSIMIFFGENPELRPYFYDNKELSTAPNDLERWKVLNAAEMVGGFVELVALQIEEQPSEIQERWKAYILDLFNSSSVLREHLASCAAWYADDLLRLLPSGRPVLTEKVSAAPDASHSANAKATAR